MNSPPHARHRHSREDLFYMDMALDLAARGKGLTSPNPMVGAVVVKDRRVVGRGWHEMAGKAHAEINALADAGSRANGATLYVTLEPCNHVGRTPACTESILKARVRRVVAAMRDPNPDVRGGGLDFLKDHGIQVTEGVEEDKARRLNEIFIAYIQTKKPFVILKCAATLDGRIATRTGDSKWVTGEQARQHVHEIRNAVDAILVGVNTIKTDDPNLTTRLKDVDGKNPVRIILDTRLTTPETAKVLNSGGGGSTILVTGPVVSGERRARLERAGVTILSSPLGENGIALGPLMTTLGQRRITSVLIEGGSKVAASAISEGAVDKILLFYAPKIFGGDDGFPIFRGKGPELMNHCFRPTQVSCRFFGDDFLVEGYLKQK